MPSLGRRASPEIKSPYRNQVPDEDHPLRRANPPAGGGGKWFGLIALAVFAPLAFIGIVTWMLMGNRPATTMPALVRTTTTTTKMASEYKPPKKKTFKIPNTSSTVSLPGTPTVEPEKKVQDAIVNRYTLEDTERNLYVVTTIRMPPADRKGDKVADWLREQLTAPLNLEANRFRDLKAVKTSGGAQGFEWRIEMDEKRVNPGVLQVYLTHDDKGSTIYVFQFADDGRPGRVIDRVDFFFSIHIGDYLPREKE